MSIIKLTFIVFILIFLHSCSYRSSSFFEDIIADNKIIKAEGQYKGSVNADVYAPIIKNQKNKKESDLLKPVISRGKIASVNFDKDYNLFVYTFIDDITKKVITFYYDKNIHYTKNTIFKIEVRGNYLYKITAIHKASASERSNNILRPLKNKSYIKHRKRRRSFIKAPIEEKINTL